MYQSRFIAYAKANNLTPDEVLARDKALYPGGFLCGFITWINQRWQDYYQVKGLPANYPKSEKVHEEFDQWLGG